MNAETVEYLGCAECKHDGITYEIGVVYSLKQGFVGLWRCTSCDEQNPCSENSRTKEDAIEQAKADLLEHHASFHKRKVKPR